MTSAPQRTSERMCGFARAFRIIRSMPRFSVASVPTIARPSVRRAASTFMTSAPWSVQTAIGARY